MAYAPDHAPITWDTLAEEAALAGTWLQVRCQDCWSRGAVSPADIGPCGKIPLRQVGERLRCLNCKAKGRAQLWIYPGGRG